MRAPDRITVDGTDATHRRRQNLRTRTGDRTRFGGKRGTGPPHASRRAGGAGRSSRRTRETTAVFIVVETMRPTSSVHEFDDEVSASPASATAPRIDLYIATTPAPGAYPRGHNLTPPPHGSRRRHGDRLTWTVTDSIAPAPQMNATSSPARAPSARGPQKAHPLKAREHLNALRQFPSDRLAFKPSKTVPAIRVLGGSAMGQRDRMRPPVQAAASPLASATLT